MRALLLFVNAELVDCDAQDIWEKETQPSTCSFFKKESFHCGGVWIATPPKYLDLTKQGAKEIEERPVSFGTTCGRLCFTGRASEPEVETNRRSN